MKGDNRYGRMSGKGIRALMLVTVVLSMSFLVVASSPEFGPYAPLYLRGIVVGIVAIVVGFIAVLITRSLPEAQQAIILGLVLITPVLIYGGLLVSLWVALSSSALLDVFIVEAGKRMLGQLATVGALGAVSMMISALVLGYYA